MTPADALWLAYISKPIKPKSVIRPGYVSLAYPEELCSVLSALFFPCLLSTSSLRSPLRLQEVGGTQKERVQKKHQNTNDRFGINSTPRLITTETKGGYAAFDGIPSFVSVE